MNTTDKTLEIAQTSPALTHQSDGPGRAEYPANFRGKVPLKVKVAKTVTPDLPFLVKSSAICKINEEYHVWVNSQGAVSAILPDGERLGLLPSEFDVTEWHPESTDDFIVECNVCKKHFKGWVGSTPCCGSIAYIVKDGKATTDMMLFAKFEKPE